MQELTGYVDHIIYRNADNGYTVMEMVVDEMLTTIVGVFPAISEGENLLVRGEFVSHNTYGEQFKMSSYEVVAPQDRIAMERYLSSGAISGIGPKLAARIVKEFGDDTFRIIEEEPHRLAEVKGISPKKAREISDQLVDAKEIRSAVIYMDRYGISTNMAMKIYGQYGNQIYTILEENPYRLADEVSGIGFKLADEIATRVGIKIDSQFRIKSGIMYVLSQAGASGHTFLYRQKLIDLSCQVLDVEDTLVDDEITNLAVERRLIVKKEFSENEADDEKYIKEENDVENHDPKEQIYSRTSYRVEDNIAGMLLELNVSYKANEADLLHTISDIEKEESLTLDELQKKAVMEAAKRGFFILTGGPGTGKTTTIKAIISLFERQDYEIYLAAPTGRAAKRMSEATGREARTIHRMLEVNGGMMSDDDGPSDVRFERNSENPLECDVIIIDEVSMVDVFLMKALLSAISPGTRLILVGDVHQLPSVGPGNVLNDILSSNIFASVALEKIFRQASGSDIVVNAHKIQQGQHVLLDNKSNDFFFLQRNEADAVISVMLTLITKKLPSYVDAGVLDIQVLTPTRKGLLGVERLNVILQQYLNPPAENKKQWEGNNRIIREGDKVMQIKNNYQMEWEILGKYEVVVDKGLGVFNGDVGMVKEISDFSKTVTVEFDDNRRVTYQFKDLDELELAYAVTIHKSQGSEYPAVIIPMLPGPKMLMNRNILYTGITRAKKCVAMVGESNVFFDMIDNASSQRRYTGLKDRLKEQNF